MTTRLSKADPPNDNPAAQQARDRKKAGLGVAGVSYLAATRGKEMGPHVADVLTRKARKVPLGESMRAERVAARGKTFARLASRGGAIGVGAGLALAGEGTFTDLRRRHVFGRAKTQVKQRLNQPESEKLMAKSAFGVGDYRLGKADDHKSEASGNLAAGATTAGVGTGYAELVRRDARKRVRLHLAQARATRDAPETSAGAWRAARAAAGTARNAKRAVVGAGLATAGLAGGAVVAHHRMKKAYTPGEISYHDTQSEIHSRKTANAGRRRDRGLAVATGGATAGALGYHYAPQIARQIGRTADKTETYTKLANAARKTTNVRRAAVLGGAGVAGVGLAAAAEGALTGRHHRQAKTRELRAVQDARRRRNAADLAKAFDSEEQRHKRHELYEGGATGGAVVAGAEGVRLARAGHKTGQRAKTVRTMAENDAAKGRRLMDQMAHTRGPNRASHMADATKAFDASHHGTRMAEDLARKAKVLRRTGAGSLAAAGALGLTAAGLHRYDRTTGRSYSY